MTPNQVTLDPSRTIWTFGMDGPAPGKPRMTQRDKWKQRPCVMAYRAWADRLRAAAPRNLPKATDVTVIIITANYAPPVSWSAKKRWAHIGHPMRSKPDGDNVAKSVCDALWDDDHKLGDIVVKRRWEERDEIEIFIHTDVSVLDERAAGA